MKITLVIPTLQQGGAERVMSELANNLTGLGHEVHLCLLAKSQDFYVVESRVVIHRLGFENKGTILKALSEVRTFIKLRRLLIQERPDVVLSFMDKFNIFTILASRFLHLKVFISDRNNPRKKAPIFRNQLKRLTYRHATGIIAQTSLAKNILKSTTKNKNIRVIANPVKKIDTNLGITKENIILNIGRMVPEKGQKYLIEAFSKMEDQNWQLVILGDGELRIALEKQIVDLNIKHKVLMPGSVKNIDEWLARSSVFAFPSVSEGFPNALIEAMAAGLPCVSFDCDAGPSDIILNRVNGILVKCKDTVALTNALNELCKNSVLRSELARAALVVKESLNPIKITLDYLNFFNSQETDNNDRRY